MIYAVFYQEADDDGECHIGNAAYAVLCEELGSGNWAEGNDNGWGCDAVDSKDKLPALRKAHPNMDIVELDEHNYQLWCSRFGEFDPSSTPEEWYEQATT